MSRFDNVKQVIKQHNEMKSIHCDRIMMTNYKNINSIMMKTVGAVVFIRLLLLIAGIEPNPGPADKLVMMFRYQFLLIEVGTILLRTLFDNTVGNDLMTYLKTYPKFAKTLKVLLDKDIITGDQKKFLPPEDKNPDTSNFDITLLTCLLRNICGLKQYQDPVWQQPANGDLSIEADITRLKNCRNYVVHKGTVYISESDFKLKWTELCQILHRLNNFCGIPNLSEMIDDIDNKPIDEQLEQCHDNILKAWHEAECMFEKGVIDMKIGQSEIKNGQSELKVGQSELKDGQSELKDGHLEIKNKLSEIEQILEDKQQKDPTQLVQTNRRLDDSEQPPCSNKRTESDTFDDIKESLKESYVTAFSFVCVTPLYSEDDRMDMLTIYTRPKMEHVPYHKSKQSEGNYEISSYEQVLCHENTTFRNVFVTGDAGMGKTTFGQCMSLLWSKNIADIGSDKGIQNDAIFMTNFEFVFYILLKETNREDVVSMIIDKYFNTSSKDEFEEKIKIIEQILRTKKCLVILDGLDEWRPDISRDHRKLTLPRKVTSDRCTFLTTCRPYIIETVRLSKMDIDHYVKITGFDAKQYVREVIGYINKSLNINKLAVDFFRQILDCGMNEQLQIPLITSQLIVVWFKYEMGKMSKAMIHGSIVEMLFERAIDNEIKFPLVESADVKFPESFSKYTYLQKYGSVLEKVCLLSFRLLFDPNFKTPSLVFSKKQLMAEPFNISPGEIDFLCQLGIISKNKVIANFGDRQLMLSFLHMSYLEFLAALFVTLFDKTGLFLEAVKKIAIDNIFVYENFLILLSGISPKMTNLFFVTFYMVRKCEFDLLRGKALTDIYKGVRIDGMQTLALNCFKKISVSVSDNSQRFIRLEDFNFKRDTLFYSAVDPCLFRDLKTFIIMNRSYAKCLIAEDYLDEFTGIKGLQYLGFGKKVSLSNYPEHVDRFNALMLQNQSTLRGLKIDYCSLSSQLPLRSLPCLTTLCFYSMDIKHDVLHDLVNYISSNILLENINLSCIRCKTHLFEFRYFGDCKLTLNLSDHSKLLTVFLDGNNLECSAINTSSLKSLSLIGDITLKMLSRSMDVKNSIQNSGLKNLSLNISPFYNFGANADSRVFNRQSEVNDVTKAIQSLRYLEDLSLRWFTIPDSVSLQLHPDIVCDEHINVKLEHTTMSDKCFHDFIDGIINHQSKVCVHMRYCHVRCDNMSHPYFKYELKPMENIKQYIKTVPGLRVKNLWKCYEVEFETIK